MASLNSIYLKKEKLQTLLNAMEKKGLTGIELTVNVTDESNQYGQNVSMFVAQTKEERDAKKERFYLGNGNTFWTDGKIQAFKKEAIKKTDDLGLPF